MLQIVVNGVFAEDFKETNFRPVFRSFSRTFCIVPVGSGWSIISDMLFVTIVSEELLIVRTILTTTLYYKLDFILNVLYLQESSKRFHIYKPKQVSSKKNNLNGGNGNGNNNTMFMEDTDEMANMDASSLYQQPTTSNYPPPPYQDSFSSFQPSPMAAPMNQQQPPPPYPGNLQTPVIQNQQSTFQQQQQQQQQHPTATAAIPFQSNPQQSNQSFSGYNEKSTKFPISSITPVSAPVSQQLPEVPINPIGNSNDSDKLTMIKNFSNESGMNNEWATK